MSKISRRKFLGTAAGATAVSAFPHVWIRPAWAQAKEVRVLAWTHFVPAYDKWFDAFAENWSTKSGVKVTIDHVPHLQIPAKIAAEIATQSGHDIVQLVGTGTEKWANALMDVQDVADKLAKKHGGWTPLADNYCKLAADGKFHSLPDFFIDFPGLYRKDLWTEIGMPNGPDTWEDLHKGGTKPSKFDDASMALLGLLLAFSFGMSIAKHDQRRLAVVADSNAIGDFYTCASLLKEPSRTNLQAVIRQYIQLRVDLARGAFRSSDLENALVKFNLLHVRMTEIVAQALSDGTPIAVSLTNTLK